MSLFSLFRLWLCLRRQLLSTVFKLIVHMGWGWWIDSLNISYEQQIFVVYKQLHLHKNANPHTHTVRKFSTMKWFFILWYYYILKLSSWNAATQYIDTVFTSIQCSRALFLFQQIFSNSAYQPGGYQPPLGHKPSPNQQNHWYISGGLLVASAPLQVSSLCPDLAEFCNQGLINLWNNSCCSAHIQ